MTVFVRNLQRRYKIDTPRLRAMTREAVRLIDAPDEVIGIILVNDKQIADLNERFHHTPGPTDILTFQFPELPGGELTISVERAAANAERYQTTPSRELALYVVHGILHLHGHNDLKARQRQRMRAAERRLLSRLGTKFDLSALVRNARQVKA